MIKKVMTWSPWLVDQYNYVKLLFQILRSEPLGFESSQKNQSSVIVLGK